MKLWAGVGAALVIAGGAAWLSTAKAADGACGPMAWAPVKGNVLSPDSTQSGLRIQTVKPGEGPSVGAANAVVALLSYKGMLTDGKVFDQNQRVPFQIGQTVPGFDEAMKMMQRGGSYKLCIPPELGYGDRADDKIPANSTLLFDVEMIDYKTMAEVQAIQQQYQAQQAQGGQAPAPPQPAP